LTYRDEYNKNPRDTSTETHEMLRGVPVTDQYVLGVDLGGSTTRVLVADIAGTQIGTGVAGGGNPVARGLDTMRVNLTEALEMALTGVDRTRVAMAVLGLAGVTTYGEAFHGAVGGVWSAVGLTCPRELRPDTEVAFAAGGAGDHGFVLLSGTGAVAAYLSDSRVARSVDGHGWLLGDRGSGFWLGREGIMAALAAIEGNGPETSLSVAIPTALGVPLTEGASVLARSVYQRPPVALAELAPIVTAAAGAGDAVALHIMARTAGALLDSLRSVHRAVGAPADLPVVLGGGVLRADNPASTDLCQQVWRGVAGIGLRPHLAQAAETGAVALAISALSKQGV
jgi:N-acetylglucosamine kinase-like BadF-type ATPase